ncbi:MAG: isochorismate synthase [Gammaproteobacteria bacterium]|nr:isochorismate synthase [Gammaproteobacteria bacterium]
MLESINIESFIQSLEQRLRMMLTANIPGQLVDDSLYTISFDVVLPWSTVQGKLPSLSIYWAQPEQRYSRTGLGEAYRYETSGPNRLQACREVYQQLLNCWHHEQHTMVPVEHCLFFAQAFDDHDSMEKAWQEFPNSLMLVPAVLLQQKQEQQVFSLSCQAHRLNQPESMIREWSGLIKTLLQAMQGNENYSEHRHSLLQRQAEPTKSEWIQSLDKAKQAISDGEMSKVVLARHLRFSSTHTLQPEVLLQSLSQHFPSCQILGVNFSQTSLIAATPERLLSLKGQDLSCDALGGTIERSLDTQEDKQKVEQILACTKTRHEHALVVEQVQQALKTVSHSLDIPESPTVLSLRQLHHLWTPVKAQLSQGKNLFDVVECLHPTPAVAGTPLIAAQNWIKQHEPFDRGWYSGVVGWLDGNGDGELSVLLRCALLKENQLDVYAGAGIVKDSDALAEFKETELKLSTLLDVLTEKKTPELEPFSLGDVSKAS